MDAKNGIENGKTGKTGKASFDLFKPVSVKKDGTRIESGNWCVRFQHQRKRTCRSLGTADYRLAQQRAKALVSKVRAGGWDTVKKIRGETGSITIDDLLAGFKVSAAGRGVRPRSIQWESYALESLAREIGAKRVGDLTSEKIQAYVSEQIAKGANPESLAGKIKSAAIVFSRKSLRSMDLAELPNPFKDVVRPRVDGEPFNAPPREKIQTLMANGVKELSGATRIAFVLALGCGLRWNEIVTLTWNNVLPDCVRVLAGLAKGRRQREVPMGKAVRGVLKATRKPNGLVLGDDATGTHEELVAWLNTKGVDDAKPVHWLRKCYGSLAVADHGLFIGSKLLGHAQIAITAKTYAGIIDKLPAVNF